jgi:hypothetical protein
LLELLFAFLIFSSGFAAGYGTREFISMTKALAKMVTRDFSLIVLKVARTAT